MRRFLALLAVSAIWAGCSATGTTTTAPPVTTTVPPVTTRPTTTTAATTTTTTTPPAPTTMPAPTTTVPVARTTVPPDCPDLADGDGTGQFAAFRADGTLLWDVPLGGRRVTATHIAGGIAVAGFADGLVVALDIGTCIELWRRAHAEPVSALVGQGTVLLIGDGAQVASVSLATGEVGWEAAWVPAGGRALVTAPDGVVLVADGDEIVARAGDGEIAWRAPLPDGAFLGLAASDDAVFAATATTAVARELASGARRWTQAVEPEVRRPPVVQGGVLYLTGATAVSAVDPDDGTVRWRYDLPDDGAAFAGPPRLDHNEVHVVDNSGRVHHLRRVDGVPVSTGRYQAERTTASRDGRLVLTTENGMVTAYNLLERRQWSIATGADGVTRITTITAAGDLILAYTRDV